MSRNTALIFWKFLYWPEMQYTFWHFHFLGGWIVARILSHCTTLSKTSKYILEFLENVFFSCYFTLSTMPHIIYIFAKIQSYFKKPLNSVFDL